MERGQAMTRRGGDGVEIDHRPPSNTSRRATARWSAATAPSRRGDAIEQTEQKKRHRLTCAASTSQHVETSPRANPRASSSPSLDYNRSHPMKSASDNLSTGHQSRRRSRCGCRGARATSDWDSTRRARAGRGRRGRGVNMFIKTSTF